MIDMPPKPTGGDWTQWARRLTPYLLQLRDRLHFKRGDEKAVDDGIILWDAANGYPVVSKNGVWQPIILEDQPLDFGIQLAEAEILGTYGDTVSTLGKAKTLLKFGKKDDLGTTTATIWQTDGNENYATTNAIDTVSSSSAADTSETFTIEGHTVTGTGENAQFTFAIQTVTTNATNGQTRVTLTTPLARVSRMYASGSTQPAGDIWVYESTDTDTAGVPDNPSTSAHIVVKGSQGETQSFKAATTFSNTDYFICTGGFASVDRKTSATVDFEMQVRTVGGVFRPVARMALDSNAQTSQQIQFYPYAIVPKNADIRIVATSSAASTEVSAQFQGFIAQVEV